MYVIEFEQKKYEVGEISVEEFFSRHNLNPRLDILGVKLNNSLCGLNKILAADYKMERVDLSHDEGYRIYKQSLLFALITAVYELFPDYKLYIRQSVSKSTYCEMSGARPLTLPMIRRIKERIHELIAARHPFEIIKTSKAEAVELFTAQGELDKAATLQNYEKERLALAKVAGRYQRLYGIIAPNAGYLKDFQLSAYETGMLLRYPNQNSHGVVPEIHSSKKLFTTIDDYRKWIEIIDVPHVYKLNELIRAGRAKDVVNLSEGLHEKNISYIADRIKANFLEQKMILISGPSSSGKTTFAARLGLHLRINGLRPVTINMDDYFKNRSDCPRHEDGSYNFEDLEALDHELFNEHVKALIDGRTVEVPRFNFLIGDREPEGNPLKLERDEVLIAEGIHALNENVTSTVGHRHKFKIYCSALTVMSFDEYNSISPTDTRLIRRIIRDNQFRSSSAENTIDMWASVQAGEIKNIFPYEEEADVMFNSSLVYEFAAYHDFAEPLLRAVPADSGAYIQAQRLLDFLDYFLPVHNTEILPPTSIIREFIGGNTI